MLAQPSRRKSNLFVQADAMVVIAAYVKKAERLSYMCAAPSV